MVHTLPVTLPAGGPATVLFAHRGARAHAPENTLEAFELALRLGATGLESDVWVTADGQAVLDHDGVVRRRLRRVPFAELDRDELPAHVPTLDDLYRSVGPAIPLSLDVKDEAAIGATLEVADDTRLYVSARWYHVSNAGLYANNPGRDSLSIWAGLSFGL